MEQKKRIIDRDGCLVSHKAEKDNTKTYSNTCHPGVSISFLTGKFLTLGDANPTLNVKDQVLSENNTVALCSALMLTVQFAFLVLHLDEDYDAITKRWGNAVGGQPWGDLYRDMYMPVQLAVITIQCIALMHSVIMILAIGEMSGEGEVARLIDKLGSRASGGFVGFVVSLIFFAGWVFFWCLLHTETTAAAIGCVVPFVIVVALTIFIYPGMLSIIQVMHNVKAEVYSTPENRPTPIVLTRPQIQAKLREFQSVLENPWLVSTSNFCTYLQEQDVESVHHGKREFSFFTMKALEEEIENVFQTLYPATSDEPSAPKKVPSATVSMVNAMGQPQGIPSSNFPLSAHHGPYYSS